MKSATAGHAWYQNLFVCGDVWCCPVCAARIGARRTEELQRAVDTADERGWMVALLTLTLRHSRADQLPALRDALIGAVSKFKQGRAYTALMHKYGLVGDIRNLEPTYGPAGFHPHCHFMLFFERQLGTAELSELEQELYTIWARKLKSVGFDATYEHGIDLRTTRKDIADYVAKFGRQPKAGWGLAEELGRSTSKRGHEDGLTPFELLAASLLPSEAKFWHGKGRHVGSPQRAAALFVEFADAFKGAHQLQWSRGLRDKLEIWSEESDEALAETAEVYADAEQVVTLAARPWQVIVDAELRAEFLEAAFHLDRVKLFAWLAMHGVYLVDLTQFDMPPPGRKERQRAGGQALP